jgi:hypothetical protein
MKAWQKTVLFLLAIVLLVPQVFVFTYFFSMLFTGSNWLGLLRSMALFGLTLSWVALPFLALAAVLFRLMISANARWFVTFPLGIAAAYLGLVAWNLLIFPCFSYGRAALPVLLCCLGTIGVAHIRALCLAYLPPEKKTSGEVAETPPKTEASDLSE